ncbi:MAG: hypothetical protein A3B74_01460 [Candidatus Kerfeldbacteria bacterium RIFCSPHIGHO2_02_FULL_42_14]|uniref:Uncharacterized protein n=1 Tax=Candidatus Kerfeldbacteria bacterium RIFCSPHIGHO2_02_FULL_42_14 TaxID=1798540 RepID=A0A1G2ASZ6_9BACT|nr:MAG: hypothetical protein A3B74_01460 [Candidatus Kerfeldbacteria bacterium RIFCSPHIGHO2_02_FULL_42_14]OGY81227.1 MAG: hypothetical protein A3E60_02975 [Candidatus Kerfeldbacteria bacterium RIFCSPHIGHO2_12_FULL_42_13]OGY83353.1 MAG: hypothetical protein A3I91_01735 [Candidatus Kerfeldbacteria bacterium RIFCSPLOWO2_02_FULL_42_19]
MRKLSLEELRKIEDQAANLPRLTVPSLYFSGVWVTQGVRMQIAYACFQEGIGFPKKTCVFSGTTMDCGSTINNVEAIVSAICKEAQIRPEDYGFYDLQTHRGYQKPSGVFEFDRVSYDIDRETGNSMRWKMEECPEEIYRAFLELIGPPTTTEYQKLLEFPYLRAEALRSTIAIAERYVQIATDVIEKEMISGKYPCITPTEAQAQGYRQTCWRRSRPSELAQILQNPDIQTEIAARGLECTIVDAEGCPHVMYQVRANNSPQRFVLYARQQQLK